MRKIQIIGNVTKDAEVRTLEGGRSVINFDLAVNERWKGKDGVKQERAYYVKCAIWRDNTSIAQYILKGTKVYVEGSPDVDAYVNKDGKAVGSVKVNVREIELLGGGKKVGEQAQASSSQDNDMLIPDSDQDLPF